MRDIDFQARSHALWRMRTQHFQQRLGFFFRLVLACSAAGAAVWSRLFAPPAAWLLAAQCLEAKVLAPFGASIGPGVQMNVTVAQMRIRAPARMIAQDLQFNEALDSILWCLGLGALLGFLSGCFLVALIRRITSEQGRATLVDRVLVGTRIVEAPGSLPPLIAGGSDLFIGGVLVPRAIETRHFAFLGTTGSGKTTALRQMLDAIEERGEAALVYDTSGEFIANYYDPQRGDVILNPFDARCAFWSPFAEIAHPADADRIARQLVSETGSGDDDVWLETSRILVANVLRSLWAENSCTLEALLDALQIKTKADLKAWLGHTSSARTFADDADRATGSVLFMLAKAANLIQFLRSERSDLEVTSGGRPFAFREFIGSLDTHVGPKPWIFVPRKEDYFEAAKPLMACWLECAASAVLGLSPSRDRRIWFVLDELADLPRVDNLARLLPEGRKFGAAIVLTFQALGQMRHRYGPEISESMLSSCNTKLFLQLGDHETREWASQTIGTCEIEMRVATDTLANGPEVPRTTVSTQRTIRAAIMESELRLPPYQGYLLLPDGHPVIRLGLTSAHISTRRAPGHAAFVPGDPRATLWYWEATKATRSPSSGTDQDDIV